MDQLSEALLDLFPHHLRALARPLQLTAQGTEGSTTIEGVGIVARIAVSREWGDATLHGGARPGRASRHFLILEMVPGPDGVAYQETREVRR